MSVSGVNVRIRGLANNISTGDELLKKCFICESKGSKKNPLRKVTSSDIDKKVRYCAKKTKNVELLEKLSHGDLISNKCEYHLACLTKVYRIDCEERKDECVDRVKVEKIKNQVIDDIVKFIEQSYETDKCVCFKFSNIVKMHKNILTKMSCDYFIHGTRLKEAILMKLPKMLVQAVGKEVFLFFLEGQEEAVSLLYNEQSCKLLDKDTVLLQKAAKLLRNDLFLQKNIFKGYLNDKCEANSTPSSLARFLNNVLRGVDDSLNHSNAVKSISQLIQFNYVCNQRKTSVLLHSTHAIYRETPIPIYIALKIYSTTRKRSIIDMFNQLGLCISYDRVQTISNQFANSVISHYDKYGIIGPSTFQKNVFTTGCVDNIDHNPSATTSKDSFHGTAISLNQHPTTQPSPRSDTSVNVFFDFEDLSTKLQHLPDEYTQVRPIVLANKNIVLEKVDLLQNVTENGKLIL